MLNMQLLSVHSQRQTKEQISTSFLALGLYGALTRQTLEVKKITTILSCR